MEPPPYDFTSFGEAFRGFGGGRRDDGGFVRSERSKRSGSEVGDQGRHQVAPIHAFGSLQ